MRINDLARELEVKSKAVLEFLVSIGVAKTSHSSSVEENIAGQVRRHFASDRRGAALEGGGVAVVEEKEQPRVEAEAPAPELEAEEAPVAAPPAAAARPAVPLGAGRPLVPAVRRGPVLRPPVRPHAPAPAVPALVPPAAEARLEGLAPVAPPVAREVTAPAVCEPAAPLVGEAAEPGLVEAEPFAPMPPPAPGPPHIPRFGVQGPLIAPRRGVPGPVSRAGGLVPRPQVTPPPPRAVPAPPRAVPPRTLAPGQPIYQPRFGAPGRAGMRAAAGAPAGQRIGRPARPGAPGAPAPGRMGERRPMHPTRALPAGVSPPGAAPAGARRPGARPQVPTRDRERPMRAGPPRGGPAVFTPRSIDREIAITEGVTVKELAEKLELKAKDLMQRLISRGVFATINQTLEPQVAKDLARDFGAETRVISFEQETIEAAVPEAAEEAGDLVARPPVVTIMGHVDHGKTSLLDAVRETHVTEQEAGGITQHIGAYQVEIKGRKITFIDTPGHEAFTRMRARGAKVTDIVVLVVAADDGVMPQTLEAIDHARAANVPIIAAVNKIDKPEAMPDRVKRQLADRGLMPEEWGGQTVTVEVSARRKQNIDLLLEMILLVADMQELKANPNRPAMATVLEAKLDRGRGPVATVLVQNGTLRVGDPFIVGPVFGKVRALLNDRGQQLNGAPPSAPVEVLGLGSLPQAGDQFQVVTDLLKAKQMATYREQKAREAALARSARLSLDKLHEQLKAGAVKELDLILKADVHGSAEVLAETLNKLGTEKIKVNIIHSGVGAITESDVLLASASNAIIIGFNVRPERNALETAEQEKVDIRLHTIIYELVDEIKKAMVGLLEPTFREVALGRAEVRDTFRVPKIGTVAGCYVLDGRVTRDAQVRLLRDNVVVYTGKVVSLRRFKDDAGEVKSGFECGVGLENFSDVKQGDVIEAFATERVAAEVLA